MIRAALLLASAAVAACGSSAEQRYTALPPCEIDGVPGRVLCGNIEVPENRDTPGRTIPLYTVVLLATGSDAKPDPIVPVQGGPGQAATSLLRFYDDVLSPLRRDRDIVLIDVRGTGNSRALPCNATSRAWLKTGELMPVALIRECREALAKRADLTQYTSATLARDLDDVRKRLGIQQWNLYGTSYGTRLAQEYTRTFGAHVRTMTLQGVAGPSLTMPLSYARDSQGALELLLDEETRALLPSVLARLRDRPATVTTSVGDVVITAGVFAEALRNLMYESGAAARAAAMIRTASEGHFVLASDAVLKQRRGFAHGIAMGMFLSVTCSEDIPRIEEARIDEASAGTFLGDYRVRQQMNACREWPRGAASGVGTLLVSDVPALLISGALDPVTPPRHGDEVLAGLPNGVHLTLPGESHGFGPSSGCVFGMMQEFIDTGSTARIQSRCGGRLTRH